MLTVTQKAANFYREDMGLDEGDAITLFVRYGRNAHGGFSFGIERGVPQKARLKKVVAGIGFYSMPYDDWYIDHMHLDFDNEMNDIISYNHGIC